MTLAGKNIKGVIDAESLFTAKERLRKQQVLVTEVFAVKSSEKELTLKAPLLLSFTREITQLLKAGLPLYESLLTIEEKYARHPAHPLFLDLCDHLKRGSPLSSALKKYPQTFDRIYLSMVEVAEESGNLVLVFEQLSALILRQQKLKKQLSSALDLPQFFSHLLLLHRLRPSLLRHPLDERALRRKSSSPRDTDRPLRQRFHYDPHPFPLPYPRDPRSLPILCPPLSQGKDLAVWNRFKNPLIQDTSLRFRIRSIL